MNIKDNNNFFLKNGYSILENVFDKKYSNKIVESAKEIKGKCDNYVPLMNPHQKSNIFLDVMSHATIIEFIEGYFDNTVMGLQTEFFFMPPNTKGFTPHQDNTYVQADENSFISAWIALTDVNENNGGLIIWPESHNEKKLVTIENKNIEYKNQDPNARSRTTNVPKNYNAYSPYVSEGSVMMIDSWLVHASNNNMSKNYRYALLCTYIKKGANFRSGNTAKRKVFSLL